jgi:multicomponent Na+:H+ antiporter subunit F
MMIGCLLALLTALALVVLRALKGPTAFDRVLAANSIGTIVILIITVYSFVSGRALFIDVALTYGLLNLIGTVALLKFIRHGDLGHSEETAETGKAAGRRA